MKNKLSDLNNHLFAQLERLSDEDLNAEEMEREIKRTEGVVKVSNQVVKIADASLDAAKLFAENGEAILPMLPKIGSRAADAKVIASNTSAAKTKGGEDEG